MEILAAHNCHGDIVHVVVLPADGPPPSVARSHGPLPTESRHVERSAIWWVAMMIVGFVACDKPKPLALMHYRQLGACRVAQTGNGVITVPPSHAVVVFRVTAIDNSKTSINWSFDSTKLQVNPPSQMQQNLGGTGPVAIAANTNVPLNTMIGILVETGNADGSDASQVNYFLLYPNEPPAPGTLGVKDNSSQVSYPFANDCGTIANQ
jgi:hypothetical protein